MKKIHEETWLALVQAQETMKKNYDQNKGPSCKYKEGDQVWLEGTNITMDRLMKKLGNKRHGPFQVVKKISKSAYRLKLPATWKKIHPVFNEALLTPYIPLQYPSQKKLDPPPPVIVNEEEEYEIDKLMDSKFIRNKLKYLVK